jgi:Astacin (Peptidase family M12A)/Bacterial tandem repeat domain 1
MRFYKRNKKNLERSHIMSKLRNLFALIITIILLAACGVNPTLPEQESEASSKIYKATLVLPGQEEPTEVSYEIIDGLAIMEGDIILGNADEVAQGEIESQALATNSMFYRWPGGIVPYTINSNITILGRTQIQQAIDHIEFHTNVDFVVRTSSNSYGYPDYIEFTKGTDSTSCSSRIGRAGGRQYLYLTSMGSCSSGNLIHELGHALGLFHEQSRKDRDKYVKINWQNILGDYKHNFDMHVENAYSSGSYDYGSIMHYGSNYYCIKINGVCKGPTIETIPTGIPIGQRSGLSNGDIAAVNALYPAQYIAYGLDENSFNKLKRMMEISKRRLLEATGGEGVLGIPRFTAKWGPENSLTSTQVIYPKLSAGQVFVYAGNLYNSHKLVHIDSYVIQGQIYYAAIWEQGTSDRPLWNWQQGYHTFSSTSSQMIQQGYKPKTISATFVNGDTRFSAVWEKNNDGTIWNLQRNMTQEGFKRFNGQMYSQGFSLLHMDVYTANGYDFYNAIWIKKPSTSTAILAYDSITKFHKDRFILEQPNRYVLTDVVTFSLNNKEYITAAWNK